MAFCLRSHAWSLHRAATPLRVCSSPTALYAGKHLPTRLAIQRSTRNARGSPAAAPPKASAALHLIPANIARPIGKQRCDR